MRKKKQNLTNKLQNLVIKNKLKSIHGKSECLIRPEMKN